MLGRQPLGGGFLDTKMHSITGRDYGPEDGWRGPDFTYGWIQGRGLEALTEFAAFFETRQPALSAALDARAALLREALGRLVARDGHAFFCYDRTSARSSGRRDRPVPRRGPTASTPIPTPSRRRDFLRPRCGVRKMRRSR